MSRYDNSFLRSFTLLLSLLTVLGLGGSAMAKPKKTVEKPPVQEPGQTKEQSEEGIAFGKCLVESISKTNGKSALNVTTMLDVLVSCLDSIDGKGEGAVADKGMGKKGKGAMADKGMGKKGKGAMADKGMGKKGKGAVAGKGKGKKGKGAVAGKGKGKKGKGAVAGKGKGKKGKASKRQQA